MVCACLDTLAAAPQISKIVLRYFEIWILRLAGSFPDVTSCAVCGKSLNSQPAYLDFESTVRCENCSRGAGTLLLPQVRQILFKSQQLGPAQFAEACANLLGDNDAELSEVTHRLIVRTLERRPRTLTAFGAVAQP